MTGGVWNVCLTHDPALGGLYRAIGDFARGLDAPILSFDDGRRDRAALSAADGAVRIPCGDGWLTRDCHLVPAAAARRAETVLDTAELLVVHSLFRAHAPWAARQALTRRRRYWSVPHGCLDPWSLGQRRLAKRAWLLVHGRAFLAGAERVVFSTARARDKARTWVRGDHAAVLHWPVDVPTLAGRDAARGRFRERLGIPADAPLLLFVGRLHPVKRPLETLARFCAADVRGAHLAMVCIEGPLTKADLARAIPPSHAGRIHLAGPFPAAELGDAYLASDGFISLSHQENFGYAAAEAVAHGLPVILSPGHDLAHDMPRDSAGRLACGWLLPDDSAPAAEQALAEWAAHAASERGTLAARGAAGRAWAADALACERFEAGLRSLAGCSAP
jgi:glycosyltransferase involved in cell wall biosynthesis